MGRVVDGIPDEIYNVLVRNGIADALAFGRA